MWTKCTERLTLVKKKDLRYVPRYKLSWKDLSAYKSQEILWQIRIFELVHGDSNYENQPKKFKWETEFRCSGFAKPL